MGLLGNMMSRLCGHQQTAGTQRPAEGRTSARHRQYTEAADAAAAIAVAAAAAARGTNKPEAAPAPPGLAFKRQQSLTTTSQRGSIDVSAAVAAAERVASMTSRHLVVTTDRPTEPGVPVTPRSGSHTMSGLSGNSPRNRQSMEVHSPRNPHRRPRSPVETHSRRGSFEVPTRQASAQFQQQAARLPVEGGCLSPRRSLPSGLGLALNSTPASSSTPSSSGASLPTVARASC
jgi:hypothetical protein